MAFSRLDAIVGSVDYRGSTPPGSALQLLQPTATATLELAACQARGFHAEQLAAPNSMWEGMTEFSPSINQNGLADPGTSEHNSSPPLQKKRPSIHTLSKHRLVIPQLADCGALCRQSLFTPPFCSTPLHARGVWVPVAFSQNDLVFRRTLGRTPDYFFVICWQAQLSILLARGLWNAQRDPAKGS